MFPKVERMGFLGLVLAVALGCTPGAGATGWELEGAPMGGLLGQGDAGDLGVDPSEVPDPEVDRIEEGEQAPGSEMPTPTGGEPLMRSGKASWYGPGFHGRRTANGEIYDQNALTCAMTGIPLGTRVRVVRVDTGANIVLRVNDRGPYERKGGRWVPHSTRVVDLSARAMRELGGIGLGLISVRVYRVD